ncbi:MAG: hypothetical protein FJ276_22390, partial [Planctomycetes bacterium]|nr:hypothetical protein [Planctomycetota bacterium]
MTIRRTRSDLFRSKKIRQRKCAEARREAIRQLRVEPLEQRRLLAGLELVGVQPDGKDFIEDGDVRDIPPTALRFVFVGNQQIDPSTLGGIQVSRAGKDGLFGNANDVVIQPGYIGLGAAPNEVMLRFVNTLPDDLYRIDIIGSGVNALRNTDGDAFNNGVDQRIQFRLDLGPQVVAVVPQPISQQPNGSLAQARNQIDVYFNDDDLHVPDAQNPALYQLIFTNDTATNLDDVKFNPVSVVYNASADRAVLTFADELHRLVDPGTGQPVGEGTFRLRIGTSEALPVAPLREELVGDVGSSFATAKNLGTLGAQAQLVASAIDPQPFVLDYPGSNHEPGHREIPEEVAGGFDNHLNPAFGEDNTAGITTILYNFKSDYGRDPSGQPLVNLITEGQKTLARQALEMWSRYIGVQFLETTDKGMTIVTGDPRALDPYASDVVNHALNKPLVDANFIAKVDPAYQDSMLILDNANQWQDSFGGDWFKTALTGIGFMLGLERATDLPSSTLMAFASTHTYPGATAPEPIFLGNHDILHGSLLHRPDSVDIDMYKFQIAAGQE